MNKLTIEKNGVKVTIEQEGEINADIIVRIASALEPSKPIDLSGVGTTPEPLINPKHWRKPYNPWDSLPFNPPYIQPYPQWRNPYVLTVSASDIPLPTTGFTVHTTPGQMLASLHTLTDN